MKDFREFIFNIIDFFNNIKNVVYRIIKFLYRDDYKKFDFFNY